jgi:hypothetical protein
VRDQPSIEDPPLLRGLHDCVFDFLQPLTLPFDLALAFELLVAGRRPLRSA